jgi:hypothetical protein
MTNRPKRDSAQPWQEIAGLTYAVARDIVASRSKALNVADQSSLANAIRDAWPGSDPIYLKMIQRRYCEVFHVPPAEAVVAVCAGYSSPLAAMRARVIRKRKRVGFVGELAP